MTEQPLMTIRQVAALAGATVAGLRYIMRTDPDAPPAIRLGGRTVRYSPADISKWFEAKRVPCKSVAETAPEPQAAAAKATAAVPRKPARKAKRTGRPRGRPRKVLAQPQAPVTT